MVIILPFNMFNDSIHYLPHCSYGRILVTTVIVYSCYPDNSLLQEAIIGQ